MELFHGLVAAGVRMRYGSKPSKDIVLRVLWEKKHIIDAGFIDYYIMGNHKAFFSFLSEIGTKIVSIFTHLVDENSGNDDR